MLIPVVLYGCETWYLTLREEYWLRMFWNRVLRKVFGPKREEVTGWCKKLHEELHDFYSSPGTIHMIKSGRISGHDVWHIWGRIEMCTEFLLEKHTGKTPLVGAKHR